MVGPRERERERDTLSGICMYSQYRVYYHLRRVCVCVCGGGGGGAGGTINVPIFTESSGTPTTRPRIESWRSTVLCLYQTEIARLIQFVRLCGDRA